MKNIMQAGDLSAVISLDTLLAQHTYGLGPAANLKGEIMMLDGRTYTSSLEKGTITTHESNKVQAAMFVYAQVQAWTTVKLKNPMTDLKMLETAIKEAAQKQNMNTDSAFPFLIHHHTGKTSYHVIDWIEGTAHTPGNHKQFAKTGVFMDESITLLGFYSTQHEGVFTHHGSYLHLHVANQDKTIIGHVDALEWPDEVELLLPKN